MGRVARALLVASAIVSAPSTRAAETQPPRYTRDQMEATLEDEGGFLFVYGTRDTTAARALRERGLAVALRRFGADSASVHPDRSVSAADLAGHPVVLIGSPRQNEWTHRLAGSLPVEFTATGFRWFGRDYEQPGEVIHLVYPHPYDPRRFLLLVAGNSLEAMRPRGGGLMVGAEDWRIYRDGELVRSGSFAQSPTGPWSYDPALDHDRDAERERFASQLVTTGTGPARVRARPGTPGTAQARSDAATLLSRMDRLGLGVSGGPPVTLTLYGSLEEKGLVAGDTRPEHLDDGGRVHAALPAERRSLDLWSVAAARLVRLGAAPDSPFLEPAGAWLSGQLEGEPLEVAVSRLYYGRLWPRAVETARRPEFWRSPLILVPARAVLARSVFDCAGPAARRAMLALLVSHPPGTLDSLCRLAGVEERRVESRYTLLSDSLARAGLRAARANVPRPWRPEDGFQRGVCLAHSVSLEGGYLSAGCGRELARLSSLGVGWVSLTPFGYLPSPSTPVIHPSSGGGPEAETDEAVCEAAAHARALGMRVWLKPHLWTRGWVGELEFGPAGWTRFFERYRDFILHYAVLAQRERMDGLVVGHELVTASLGHPERWRELIAEVRRVYSGTVTYGANWGEEVGGITFWDALDLVAVSFYDPLAEKPTRSVPALRAAAERALAGLRALGQRTGKPVLLLEAGYAAFSEAPVRPWEEARGAPDPETQRACYEALVQALEDERWVAGVFWWKWFSSERGDGRRDGSFSPRGRPAQHVMSRALRSWERRAVVTPATTGGARTH